MSPNRKQDSDEMHREDVEVLIFDGGRIVFWGRQETLAALYEELGEKEFPEASVYCG